MTMTDGNAEWLSVLNNLIQMCKDREIQYAASAYDVANDELKALFTRYAQQSAGLAAELVREMRHFGANPIASGDMAKTKGRDEGETASSTTEGDEVVILSNCERHEAALVERYEQALKIQWPTALQPILMRHYTEVRNTYDIIHILTDAIRISPSE